MSPEETIAKLTESLPAAKTAAGCEKCLDRAFELLDACVGFEAGGEHCNELREEAGLPAIVIN